MKVVSGGVPLLAEFNGIYFPIVSYKQGTFATSSFRSGSGLATTRRLSGIIQAVTLSFTLLPNRYLHQGEGRSVKLFSSGYYVYTIKNERLYHCPKKYL